MWVLLEGLERLYDPNTAMVGRWARVSGLERRSASFVSGAGSQGAWCEEFLCAAFPISLSLLLFPSQSLPEGFVLALGGQD